MKYQNNQLWSECQMISLFNAMRYHNLPSVPEMGTKEYEKICTDYCCINGACLKMSTAYKKFGLKRIKGPIKFHWIRKNLPVELGVFCHQGYHSILIVGTKKNKLLLANYAKNRLSWMEWKNLIKRIKRDKPYSIIVKKGRQNERTNCYVNDWYKVSTKKNRGK